MSQDTNSEVWRRECEARQVLRWPLSNRRAYLELVGKRRGETARKELEMEVTRQHRLARSAA